MKRKTRAVFQRKGLWCGVEFAVEGRSVEDIRFHMDKDLPDLRAVLDHSPCAVSLGISSGYLLTVTFPFSGRKKIELVIAGEVADRVPFSLDDMATDFEELGKGDVLVAVVPKSMTAAAQWGRHVTAVTMNGAAALHGLRWARAMESEHCLFLYGEENAVFLVHFEAGRVRESRQFVYQRDPSLVVGAVRSLVETREIRPDICYFLADEGFPITGAELGRETGIKVEAPRLKGHPRLSQSAYALWTGIGAGLLALNPPDGLNLLGRRRAAMPVSLRTGVFVSGALAAAALILAGLSYVNLSLHQGAYSALAREQEKVYRTVFPKAPPVKEVEKVLEERLRVLEREGVEAGIPGSSSPLGILAQVSSRIDGTIDVKLTEFQWDDTGFSLTGTTVSFGAAEKVKTSLEQIGGVKAVEIQNMELTSVRQVAFKMRVRI